MVLKKKIKGKHIVLRSAEESDARFILKLRLDPALNKFLHKTDRSIKKQREYISAKRKAPGDYHMIIQALDGKRLGVAAIYDIDSKKKTFDWGRWVVSKKAPIYTASESIALVYYLAFNVLKMEKALLKVYRDNSRMVNFHKSYGAKAAKQDRENVYLSFSKKSYRDFYLKHHMLDITKN